MLKIGFYTKIFLIFFSNLGWTTRTDRKKCEKEYDDVCKAVNLAKSEGKKKKERNVYRQDTESP